MHDQFAHIVRQTGPPAAAKLRLLRKRLDLVTELLAEPARPGRIVLANIGQDGVQVLARLYSRLKSAQIQ